MKVNKTTFWNERSTHEGFKAVLDPYDMFGLKNEYIDYLQKKLLIKTVKRFRGKNILDFGCGVGRMSSWLNGINNNSVIGYDFNQKMVDHAKKLNPNIKFISKFEDCSKNIDIIFTLWVLQHIVLNKDITSIFRKILEHNDVKFVFLLEKTANYPHTDKVHGTNFAYQKVRSTEEYIKIMTELGFKLTKVTHSSIRTNGIFLRYLCSHLSSYQWSRLFPVFYFIDNLYGSTINSLKQIREKDSVFLFYKNH